jgi:signal transduction histidine kinase
MKPDAPLHPHDVTQELKSHLPSLPAAESPHALLDSLPGLVYRARVDRHRTLEQASGSPTLLGIKPEALPFHLAPRIHPDDLESVLEVIKTAVANNHPFAVEYRLQQASGAWLTVWEQGRPIRHGQQWMVQGQLLDVTQRILRERARLATELSLLQAQKFQALNQLASGVAHEFNNQIAGILGSAELVAMDLPEGHPARDTLKQIFEASNHARDFVHQLRLLGQRQPPDFKPIRLQPVIEESLQILRTIIPAKLELVAHIHADCPKVNADSAQIHQAIMDLCLHAWQGLADRRGRIVISLERCATVRPPAGVPSQLQPGPHACLTVKDNSPGLEKNAREHIFHPFRNRRPGGTKVGLELFQVRETIQAHLGEIFLESEPGSGLAFHIYLPLAVEN